MPTLQDFIDDDLSLFYYTTPRGIVQLFKDNKTTATGRLVFDYLMLNYSRKLNHTHKITNAQVADWVGCSAGHLRRELAHLKQIDAIRRHPDKRNVYLIPCLAELRNMLHEYRLAQKEADFQARVDERLEEYEFDHIHDPHANPFGNPLTEDEKAKARQQIERHLRADEAYKERAKKKRAKTAAQFELPFADE